MRDSRLICEKSIADGSTNKLENKACQSMKDYHCLRSSNACLLNNKKCKSDEPGLFVLLLLYRVYSPNRLR